MSTQPVRILIGDDHPIIRNALCSLFANAERYVIAAMACSFPEVIDIAHSHPADVLILDLGDMAGSPLDIIKTLKHDCPNLKIIIFSSTIDLAPDLLKAGAAGYVAKEELPSVLLDAITAVIAGQTFRSRRIEEYLAQTRREVSITPKEFLALKLHAQGLQTHEIAEFMGIQPRCAQNHITSLLRKTGCPNRHLLAKWYRRKYEGS